MWEETESQALKRAYCTKTQRRDQGIRETTNKLFERDYGS